MFKEQIPGWIRRLRKVETSWGAALLTLEGHSSAVEVVTFSPDGKLVASGSTDGTVKL
jgi:WD40 repeat protein